MNPYSVLGVAQDADDDTIKQAYRSRAKAAHPDAGGSEEQFHQLKLARDVLLDPARRQKFDNTGEVEPSVPDRVDAAAFGIIAQMLAQCLMGDPDPNENPLIEPMVNYCLDQINKAEQAIKRFDRAEHRGEKMLKRFRRKKRKKKKGEELEEDRNVMQMLLAARLKDIRNARKGIEENLAVAKRALQIVEEYEFDWEQIQRVAYRHASDPRTSTGLSGGFGGLWA